MCVDAEARGRLTINDPRDLQPVLFAGRWQRRPVRVVLQTLDKSRGVQRGNSSGPGLRACTDTGPADNVLDSQILYWLHVEGNAVDFG